MTPPSHDPTLGQARSLVRDLFRHRRWIYWSDFLVTLTVGYAAASVYLLGQPLAPLPTAALLVAALALYRLASFMHEIVHLKRADVPGFAATWNILAGIPMLMPSFFYESHIGHHNTRWYGTDHDGEYLPMGRGPWPEVLMFLLQVFIQPLFIAARFLVLTPVSLLNPRLRAWTLERASSFVINLRYRRPLPDRIPRWWLWIEVACFARMAAMVTTVAVGIHPWTHLVKLYLLATLALALNHVRTLAAHRYVGQGETMSHQEQFLDSTNIRGGWWTELWCPLGLRYHALHHLFPAMPYHNLGRAHRRLMEGLPAGSCYRDVEYPSFWAVIGELRRRIREATQGQADSVGQTATPRQDDLPARWEASERPTRSGRTARPRDQQMSAS